MRADPEDVVAFVEVAKHGSFSAAARALGVPKSSISRRLQKLERTLRTQLVSRTTRTLSLTDAGRGYFERTRRALEEFEGAERVLEGLLDEPRGVLKITVPTSVEELVQEIVEQYLSTYSEVAVVAHVSNARIDLVREGYDLALRAGRLSDSTLIARKLADSRLLLAASAAYLERHGTPETLQDLRNHTCLVFGTSGVECVWELTGPQGQEQIGVSGVIGSNDLGFLKRAAIGGLGIGRFPEQHIRMDLTRGQLVQVLSQYTGSTPPLYAVYPSTSHLSPKVARFVEVCLELVPRRCFR